MPGIATELDRTRLPIAALNAPAPIAPARDGSFAGRGRA
jgi:hypothetical protein